MVARIVAQACVAEVAMVPVMVIVKLAVNRHVTGHVTILAMVLAQAVVRDLLTLKSFSIAMCVEFNNLTHIAMYNV